MIPATYSHTFKSTLFKLQAAISFHIETYGTEAFTLDIGMQHDFTWSFTQGNVKTPILEADFLAYFNLAVHLKTLLDKTTSIFIINTHWWLPLHKYDYTKKEFQKMLNKGIIRLVLKHKCIDFQVCIDYKKLNFSTIPDR